jgi:hypothetical protein
MLVKMDREAENGVMCDEIVPADKKHRWLVLGWSALVVAAGVVAILLIQRLMRLPEDPTAQELEAAAERAVRLVTVVAWVSGVGFVGTGLWFVRLGYRISRSGRYPPPGTKVIRNTVVRTGAKARGLALLALMTGLVSAGAGSAAAWALWRLAVLVLER